MKEKALGTLMQGKIKKGFTLAETIMTLFIVGLVVTAAIPIFTQKKYDPANYCAKSDVNCDSPWYLCQNNPEVGLCTDKKVVIGDSKPYDNNSLTIKSDLSLYDIFSADERVIKVGKNYFQEIGTNLLITNVCQKINPIKAQNNLLIGAITGISNSLSDFHNNVIVGNGNTIKSNNQVDVVVGNDNTLSANVWNAVVVGNDNKLTGTNGKPDGMVSIGNGNKLAYNSFAIGKDLTVTENNFNIGNQIYGNKLANGTGIEINFSNDINISGTFTVETAYKISDIRLKNIKDSYNKGLKEILQVNPITFSYKSDNSATEQYGIVAQEVQKIFPEAVVKMPSGYLGVDTAPIFFAMLNSLKEIDAKTTLETKKNVALQAELSSLEAEIKNLTFCKASNLQGKLDCFFKEVMRRFKYLIASESGAKNAKE